MHYNNFCDLIWPVILSCNSKTSQMFYYTVNNEGEQKYQHFLTTFWIWKGYFIYGLSAASLRSAVQTLRSTLNLMYFFSLTPTQVRTWNKILQASHWFTLAALYSVPAWNLLYLLLQLPLHYQSWETFSQWKQK